VFSFLYFCSLSCVDWPLLSFWFQKSFFLLLNLLFRKCFGIFFSFLSFFSLIGRTTFVCFWRILLDLRLNFICFVIHYFLELFLKTLNGFGYWLFSFIFGFKNRAIFRWSNLWRCFERFMNTRLRFLLLSRFCCWLVNRNRFFLIYLLSFIWLNFWK
jgi:hypothetical protein